MDCRPGSRPMCATSSHSTPIPGCRATPRAAWSARWHTRSIGLGSTPPPAMCWRATRCCSRGSPLHCRLAAKARCFSACSRAAAASTPMPRRCPMSIRMCSARDPTPARAFTRSTRLKRRWPAACLRGLCSATICSRESSRAPDWSRTSSWSRSFHRAMTSLPRASTAGRVATGNCCRGSSDAAAAHCR